ncbi:MAG: hypothetical protein WBA93_07935 [Microcoleaceae cyanobacterium]
MSLPYFARDDVVHRFEKPCKETLDRMPGGDAAQNRLFYRIIKV